MRKLIDLFASDSIDFEGSDSRVQTIAVMIDKRWQIPFLYLYFMLTVICYVLSQKNIKPEGCVARTAFSDKTRIVWRRDPLFESVSDYANASISSDRDYMSGQTNHWLSGYQSDINKWKISCRLRVEQF
jgi:hypothetical protein